MLKKYWYIIAIGLIIRLVIAAFAYHPDVKTTPIPSAVLLRGGSLDFYGKSVDFSKTEVLDDLPLSYFINIPFHAILHPFVFTKVEDQFLTDPSQLYGNPVLWFYLIYTKLPMLVFDMALGVLLSLCVSENFRKKVLLLWFFNPFTLWVTAAVGQFDVYPTFFIVLAFYLIKKKRLNWAALSLGAGGAIKSSPFLLVPFLVGLGKNWTERITILILATVPYLVTVLPYLGSPNFRRNALFAPQLSKSLYANLALSGGEQILLVPLILIGLYLFYLSKNRSSGDFLNYSIATLLSVLSLTHFHMQWFLWVTPFLTLWLLENWNQGTKLVTTGIIAGLLIMLFLFESSLQMQLFAPLFPVLKDVSGLKELLTDQQGIFVRSIGATIFAGANLYLIWKILNHRGETS